jgi:hypothetical protein
MPNTKDPELTALLDRLKKTCDERKKLFPEQADEVTRKAVQEVHTNLQTQTKKPRQLPLGLLPTDLCRTTWCRPMRPKDMSSADEPKKQIFETSWAKLTVVGPDCGMKEEDLLIVVLKRWVAQGCKPIQCRYADLLDDLEYKRSKTARHYRSSFRKLKDCLSRLALTSFILEQPQTKGRVLGTVAHVLNLQWNEEKETLLIDPDPWFAATIGMGFITGINLEERKKLKGDNAKALHRFLSSQGLEGHHNIFLLAAAIGMDMTQPEKKIRQNIKVAVSQLKSIGFLLKKTQIRNDILHWHRSRHVLSGPTLATEIQRESFSVSSSEPDPKTR